MLLAIMHLYMNGKKRLPYPMYVAVSGKSFSKRVILSDL